MLDVPTGGCWQTLVGGEEDTVGKRKGTCVTTSPQSALKSLSTDYKPRGSGAAAGAQPCKEAARHPRPGRDTES